MIDLYEQAKNLYRMKFIKFILLNWSIIILLSIPVLMGVVWIQDQMYISRVAYLVFEGGGNRMEEGKLYIRDKEKAQRITKAFIRNPYFLHACGYWYTLTGYDKNHHKVFEEPLNGECDDYWFQSKEINTFIKDCRKKLSKPKPSAK